MGIPSYFAQVIRSFTRILSKQSELSNNGVQVSRLYLDCNSILYDSFHSLPQTLSYQEMKREIIKETIKRIENYVEQFSPSGVTFVAFDGVAPVAKMEQQRSRRYKSWFESTITNEICKKTSLHSSCMFTPGTDFMNTLCTELYAHFKGRSNVIVSASDSPGEGEHKLYQHLRNDPPKSDENVAIYGLDADLLMLSLVHSSYCNLYVCRESPHFASVLLSETKGDVEENELICIHIKDLASGVLQDMNCSAMDTGRIHDYVFLCFLLGNDFLPHFPSINIRTKGIDTIIEVYNEIVSSQNKYLINVHKKINWKVFHEVIAKLGKDEYGNICKEYAFRRKWDKKTPEMTPKQTEKDKLEMFQNIPILYRHKEKYISPYEKNGWKQRYYRSLFGENTNVSGVCQNYLEGIEWVTQYYMEGKVDWNWKYNYHYPPLFVDLYHHFSSYKGITTTSETNQPVRMYTQLAYVLPPVYHSFLPVHIRTLLTKEYSHLHVYHQDGLEFAWSFCRYFWESHVELPQIGVDTIRTWDKIFL